MRGWNNLEDLQPELYCSRMFASHLIAKATGKPIESFYDQAERLSQMAITSTYLQTLLRKCGYNVTISPRKALKRWEVVKLLRENVK
jgi:hypothetical protein